MRKPSLLVIFLMVFVDLVGFGMVLPLLPKYVRDFGAPGWLLGAIVASYSLMQFLFAPAWGRLSDRIGRRPVLLISTAGFIASYSLFAVGSTLTHPALALGVILASRVLSGVCGANIAVAQAYIADLSTPAERSRRMGLIGMAFGLGFIAGPIIAVVALLAFGRSGPGWCAATICAINLVLAWFLLGESRSAEAVAPPRSGGRFDHWRTVLARPHLGLLAGIYFLATFAFTCFETTLAILIAENFRFPKGGTDSEIAVSFLFAFCGLIGALVQGGMIGRLVRLLGESRMIALSLLLTALSLAPLPFFTGALQHSPSELWRSGGASVFGFLGSLFTLGGAGWIGLIACLAILSIGSSMTRPPLFGLVSSLSPSNEQGFTLGVTQSAGSLARITGPVFASATFDWHHSFPYVICAALALGAFAWCWIRLPASPQPGAGVS
ncbi:MAG: MFS transporter [Verrucomicrobiales bacterium]|nr:MFS transporter [Verrucomicrobiales bacterium]